MNDREFKLLVRSMRKYQKAFRETKCDGDWTLKNHYEEKVDKALEKFTAEEIKQLPFDYGDRV